MNDKYYYNYNDAYLSFINDHDEEYLMHHGIKGMKWGVRRFQDLKGSLTAAGKKRYADAKSVYNYAKYRAKKSGFGAAIDASSKLSEYGNKAKSEYNYGKYRAKKSGFGALLKAQEYSKTKLSTLSEYGSHARTMANIGKQYAKQQTLNVALSAALMAPRVDTSSLRGYADIGKQRLSEYGSHARTMANIGKQRLSEYGSHARTMANIGKQQLRQQTLNMALGAALAIGSPNVNASSGSRPVREGSQYSGNYKYASESRNSSLNSGKSNPYKSYMNDDTSYNTRYKEPAYKINSTYNSRRIAYHSDMDDDSFLYHSDIEDDSFFSLAHYGIKGQKWGERRYQNKDMSLTPLGRVHYNVGEARKAINRTAARAAEAIRKKVNPTVEDLQEEYAKAKEKQLKKDMKNAIREANGKKKKLKDMSDDEIRQELYERRNKENLKMIRQDQSKLHKVGKFVKRLAATPAEFAGSFVSNMAMNMADMFIDQTTENLRRQYEAANKAKVDRIYDKNKSDVDRARDASTIAKATFDVATNESRIAAQVATNRAKEAQQNTEAQRYSDNPWERSYANMVATNARNDQKNKNKGGDRGGDKKKQEQEQNQNSNDSGHQNSDKNKDKSKGQNGVQPQQSSGSKHIGIQGVSRNETNVDVIARKNAEALAKRFAAYDATYGKHLTPSQDKASREAEQFVKDLYSKYGIDR